MRKLLETATGIATGSTGSLNTGTLLQYNGLKGQRVCDDRVWITKAHHPTFVPNVLKQQFPRASVNRRCPKKDSSMTIAFSFGLVWSTL